MTFPPLVFVSLRRRPQSLFQIVTVFRIEIIQQMIFSILIILFSAEDLSAFVLLGNPLKPGKQSIVGTESSILSVTSGEVAEVEELYLAAESWFGGIGFTFCFFIPYLVGHDVSRHDVSTHHSGIRSP